MHRSQSYENSASLLYAVHNVQHVQFIHNVHKVSICNRIYFNLRNAMRNVIMYALLVVTCIAHLSWDKYTLLVNALASAEFST